VDGAISRPPRTQARQGVNTPRMSEPVRDQTEGTMSDEEGDKYRVAEPMGLPEAPYHQDVAGNSA
jgi:hypothetical protein